MIASPGIAAEISSYLKSQQNEILNFLSRLLEKESPTSAVETQGPVFEQLGDLLTGLGYEVEHVAGDRSGGSLLAQPAGADRRLNQLLMGHTDTVWPIGTIQQMPVRLNDNRLRGPGVYDMKGGLTQMMFSLKAISELGLKPEIAPVVFINSDEEIGSPDSQPHIEALAKTANRAFILEPSLGPIGKLKTARKGVGQFTIEVIGKSAHAGLDPEKGASAILEMSFVIQKLYDLNDPARGVTVNVGTIEGGLRPNVIAPNSKVLVDVRTPTLGDARRLEQAIYHLDTETSGVHIRVEGAIGRRPLERTARNQALWQHAQGLGRKLGLELEQGSAGGGSDGNITSQFTATLDGLGAVGDGAHALHEFIFVDKLVERSALLALLVLSPALTGDTTDEMSNSDPGAPS